VASGHDPHHRHAITPAATPHACASGATSMPEQRARPQREIPRRLEQDLRERAGDERDADEPMARGLRGVSGTSPSSAPPRSASERGKASASPAPRRRACSTPESPP
jgi:hypothetical protein